MAKQKPKRLRVAAFDLGTSCGYAYDLTGTVHSGVLNLRGGRYEGGGMRYLRFRQFLQTFYQRAGGIDLIVFEEVRRHKGVDAAHVHGGLLAELTAFCEERSVPYEGVPVATIKKYATGKGNSNKAGVINAVRMMGFEPKDDNEADALALLLYQLNRI